MILKLNQVEKNYKNFQLSCSLQVEEGRITGLIGQNGAGKSTAFKAALQLIQYVGTVEIFGKKAEELEQTEKEKIGVALAESGFSGYLSVNEIIQVMKGLYREFDEEMFRAQCNQYNLPLNQKIKEFSTGMKAKLKILLALSHKASLLVLDEPTLGLDVIAREEILDMLRSYMEENPKRGILISSHISSDLENLCDDIYMIDQGKIVMYEENNKLLSEYGVLKMTEKQYQKVDRKYILRELKDNTCMIALTKYREFYQENYPEIVIEKGSIDEVISLMIKGKSVQNQ